MLKKLYFLIMLLSILFVFSGCEEFYTFNLFKGLDYVPVISADKLNEKTPEDGVAYLKEEMSSDAYMEAVAKDPDAVIAINIYLEAIYTDPAQSDTLQVSAAVLAGDLNLAVTGGDEVVNNVLNALQDIQTLNSGEALPEGQTEADAIQSIISAIIPASIITFAEDGSVAAVDQVGFTALIDGMLAANAAYEALGSSIDTAGVTAGTVVYTDVTGGVVMNALVTGLVDSVATTIVLPDADVSAVLYAMLMAPAGTDLSTIEGINPGANFDNVLSNLSYLENIALAAGADLTSLLGQEEPVAP